MIYLCVIWSLQWRHNGRDSVSNHQPRECLLSRLIRRRLKKTSTLRVTGLCAGNSPETGEFSAQRASNAENVSMWWRHHDIDASRSRRTANHMYAFNLWFVCHPYVTKALRCNPMLHDEQQPYESLRYGEYIISYPLPSWWLPICLYSVSGVSERGGALSASRHIWQYITFIRQNIYIHLTTFTE